MTAIFRSPLSKAIEQFLEYKRSVGCLYKEEERALGCFDRFLELHIDASDPVLTLSLVRSYLAEADPKPKQKTRSNQLSLIRELCRYLAVEDPRTEIPPRDFLRIRPRPFIQRVLSRQETQAFLAACSSLPPSRCSPLRSVVHGTALTLLCLTGLRLGEALRLTLEDADLSKGILRVRKTKFRKSRLVPIAADLTEKMGKCKDFIEDRLGVRDSHEPFFTGPKGKAISSTALRGSFRAVLVQAGIAQSGTSTRRPRLHDLRGTFAVHRLLLWYEQDVNLTAKLPLLSTYLGHVGLASTQRYLQLTTDFIGEVNRRYETCFGHLIEDWEDGGK